jgi:hypothetical protein
VREDAGFHPDRTSPVTGWDDDSGALEAAFKFPPLAAPPPGPPGPTPPKSGRGLGPLSPGGRKALISVFVIVLVVAGATFLFLKYRRRTPQPTGRPAAPMGQRW